ncbi:Peptidase family M23 [Brevibacterium siliguriense]|uniref:Peptidase family M23 n=1 Tax=Brevibacterium siliguriense TaxID=1136497 RepID=A0A1H1S5Q2_9MICO|nr:D-alanyl-D-alanine carboxypeptidase family protein [Brevibacterium siliguriense]SDS43243.1 Peptidase family M23 [Brevibacterium siliguriense]
MTLFALDRLRQLSDLRARRSGPGSPQSLFVAVIVALGLVLMTTPLEASAASESASTTATSGSQRSAPTNWVTPVPAMEIIEAFDPPDKPWLKGHRGIDVFAVEGEPLRAPTGGTIRFAGTVAGMATVSILTETDHVLTFQPAATSLEKGESFAVGEQIGTVGSGSHCQRSCLHIGAWPSESDKRYVDPGKFFGQEQSALLPLSRKPAKEPEGGGDSTTSGAGAWGGHSNGRIPASAMCQLRTAPGQMLRCDAQAAFDRLSKAFEARFGAPISVTDAYRDYATQVILKRRKGRMAATPGTSNHGWALAVDLGSGINSFGTAQHQWMRANAPKFGWIHPGWARQTGSLPEPWHWQFRK